MMIKGLTAVGPFLVYGQPCFLMINFEKFLILEASHSGLVHTLGKRATCQRVRGFESLRFPHIRTNYTNVIGSYVKQGSLTFGDL